MKTVSKPKKVYPYVILSLLLTFPLALFLTEMINKYWNYCCAPIDAGQAFALLFGYLPFFLMVFILVSSTTSFLAWFLGFSGRQLFLLNLLSMTVVFVTAFLLEVQQAAH